MVSVLLLAGLRERMGSARLELPAGRVRELLDELVRRGGDELARACYADPAAPLPTPSRDLRVLVNGRSIQFLDGLDTPLEAADTVTIHLAGARGWPGG